MFVAAGVRGVSNAKLTCLRVGCVQLADVPPPREAGAAAEDEKEPAAANTTADGTAQKTTRPQAFASLTPSYKRH